MTICISALAQYTREREKDSAIVCVADKAVTWDENIQWESDVSKVTCINPSGIVVCEAGDENSISRMMRKLADLSQPENSGRMVDRLEEKYKTCFQEMTDIIFLDQRRMTRQEYITAISGTSINPHIEKLAKEMAEWDMDCDLLVCGFDSAEKPYLLEIVSPGLATDMTRSGFEAIGSGSDRATPRMLWSKYKKSNPIEHVLYDLFDAKANAEMNVGVGYEWDATIVFKDRCVAVPDEQKKLLERGWNDASYGPFDVREPDDLEPAPKDWKEQLKAWIGSISSNAPSPPPSQ